MTKQSEEEMMNFFVKAFEEVLVPILERHEEKITSMDKRIGGLGGRMVDLQDTLDSHTASLMELEKLPQLVGEVYQEVKGIRIMQRNQDERIAKLERKVTNI